MLAAKILLASIPLIVAYYSKLYEDIDKAKAFPRDPPDFNLPVKETFDFIIVGGGVAGCVLANRLSKHFRVLVIEAGGDPVPTQSVPLLSARTENLGEINFLFDSSGQKKAALENNGVIPQTQGKMLGGSGSHNEMIWERGNPKDYDKWADITGDSRWKYENIRKYFKKIERFYNIQAHPNDERGRFGRVHIRQDTFAPGVNLWFSAAPEVGYQVVDTSESQKIGFKALQFSKKGGQRDSAFTAYLKPILTRKNLEVYRYSLVSRVIFDGIRAVGVEYTRHGIPRAAFASKEVILSAGSLVSPLILIKSGIGPRDQISAAKVKPFSVLPVGKTVKNHPLLTLPPYTIDPKYAWNLEANLTFEDIDTFKERGRGPLSGSAYAGAEALITSTREAGTNWPDLQISYLFSAPSTPNAVACMVTFTRERSTGTLKLNTSALSMEDDHLPILDLNYFDDQGDLDAVLEGIDFCGKVFGTKPFRDAGARMSSKVYPPCSNHTYLSRDYWKCYIRHKTRSTRHVHATCRMGRRSGDRHAVVDSKLRVIGVKRLRVVDQSVIPNLNVNTMAPTMLVAEKAAATILRKYKLKK